MIDHAAVKTGRIAPSRSQRLRALPMLSYMKAPLPVAPSSSDQIKGSAIGMFSNDRLGCCVLAGLANSDAIWARIEGRKSTCSGDDVAAQYLALTGGQDTGLVEISTLQLAQTTGLKLGGDPLKLAAWVTVPVADKAARSSLIALFGSNYLGVALPLSSQGQAIWNSDGSLTGNDAPGSWGGHCLLEAAYDETNRGLVTWGTEQLCTEEWIQSYCDEAYVLLDAERASAANVDWSALLADMQNVPTS